MTAAALAGFALALLLPRDQEAPARAGGPGTAPSAPAAAPAPPGGADPDGAGTLREGDSGPDVVALQRRLLRVPDVYTGGSTDGGYDATLTAAVARFQLWYGIRGDETGVYGDDTRAALESRTAPAP
ncbi:peptidoglycan-binding protein [Streptomyces sp. NPDC058108]|uniref:peptidoglycan-binding protein n=1 Tax=Streptomyces sp. NPDC058108 TaxID=3346344 RepID=UPI0036E43DAE